MLPLPGSKQAHIKFNQYKYCTKALLVSYADFKSILEPFGRQVKRTTYTQQHKVCAAAAILTSSFYNFDQRTVIKVGEKALAEFLDSLIVWEAEIVPILRTNRAMKRLSDRQQNEYENAIRCYICRHDFVEGNAMGPKVRDHDYITGWFIGDAHRQCNRAPGMLQDPSVLLQLPWLRCAPNRPRIWQATRPRDQSDWSKHGEVSSGRVGQEHSIPRLSPILACFHGAVCAFAR